MKKDQQDKLQEAVQNVTDKNADGVSAAEAHFNEEEMEREAKAYTDHVARDKAMFALSQESFREMMEADNEGETNPFYLEKLCVQVLDKIIEDNKDIHKTYLDKGIGGIINWLNTSMRREPFNYTMNTMISVAATWYILMIWFLSGRLDFLIEQHPGLLSTISKFQEVSHFNSLTFKPIDHETFVKAALSALKKKKGLPNYYNNIDGKINLAVKKIESRIKDNIKKQSEAMTKSMKQAKEVFDKKKKK